MTAADFRDSAIWSMLDHPHQADEIAAHLSDPEEVAALQGEPEMFADHAQLVRKEIVDKNGKHSHRWVHPETGEQHETHPVSGEPAAPNTLHPAVRSKLAQLLRYAVPLPTVAKDKAAAIVAKMYAPMEQRYGKWGAKLVVAGMLLPLPGTLVGAPLLAEGVKRLRDVVGFAEGPATMDAPTLAKAIRDGLNTFFSEIGGKPPALSNEQLMDVAEQLLMGE